MCNTWVHFSDAMVLEEWKHEVQKIEEKLKAFEQKYINRCKDFKVCKKSVK